ncbi:TPA: hypothetical protein ACY3G5_001910 [Morganella morganii]|uniref:hypothetical protein n=1 Tax=Morganella TaxID=581 RepID=UPI0003DCDFB2|nr:MULTISPECIES: hypothetical protein [Morganella]HBZ5600307.1 hypothetical protein [Morganella morganii]MBT0401022.1 hypothetical protein [Morganella morganii subsp. morganii]OFV02206.1 hypothetical protein HMPREF3119_04200 [Morganella sp. HMSC11D09]CDK68213.1 Phage protein [Morganella morganii IS15]HCR4002926.1 hypothetical protein [Morganella morganii]
MKQKYVYQSPENYAEKVNDNDGIKQLSITSMIEELLREMDQDGHDVSGPMTELVALKNYVNYSEKQLQTVKTHLEFVLSELNK